MTTLPINRYLGPALSPVLVIALLAGCATDANQDYAERMGREHTGDTPVASPAANTDPVGKLITEDPIYANLDGDHVSGYLARPEGVESAPGILVIQEWWGLNDNIRAMAERLAGEGYIALAVDLYEGEVAEDRDSARSLMQNAMANPERVEDNLRQARSYLAEVGGTKIGSIGWCFGGGWSLRSGLLLGNDIDAVVMFYGRVVTEEELEGLQAPLLGHFGSDDQGIPIDSVRQFESALGRLEKTATVYIYEGADHAFANPSGTRYQKQAAELAWERTLAFYGEHLR